MENTVNHSNLPKKRLLENERRRKLVIGDSVDALDTNMRCDGVPGADFPIFLYISTGRWMTVGTSER